MPLNSWDRLSQFVFWLYTHRWDFAYRVAASILLLAWIKLFPRYVLMLYLGEKGIPPFELVGADLPGAHVILAWTLMILVFGGLYLWLPFILLVLRKFYFKTPEASAEQDAPKSLAAQVVSSKSLRNFAAFLSVFLIAMILLLMFAEGRMEWHRLFYLALLSFVVVICVFLFFRRRLSESLVNWRGPMAFVFLSIFVPIAANPAITETLDATFRRYRVGGGLPVQIERFGDVATSVEGRLLLLGNRNIYVGVGEGKARKLVVITNTENLVVTIGDEPPNRAN